MIELNKIYHENCLETMSRMPSNSVDMVLTSPPYDDLRNYNGYSFDFEAIANELFRILKKNGIVIWVVGDKTENGSEQEQVLNRLYTLKRLVLIYMIP